MKQIKINLIGVAIGLLAVACNNDFMDRFPETQISSETFFQSVTNLELYTNTYYDKISTSYSDGTSVSLLRLLVDGTIGERCDGIITCSTMYIQFPEIRR